MKIAVVDGQGGGIGKELVEKLKKAFPNEIEILALGTNSLATSAMMRSGASRGATGENAICWNSARVDVIMGVTGILAANSMMGELTEKMASAISMSEALKILIPLNRCNVEIAGVDRAVPISELIDNAVILLGEIVTKRKG